MLWGAREWLEELTLEWEVALLLEKWVEEVGSGDGRIEWVHYVFVTNCPA